MDGLNGNFTLQSVIGERSKVTTVKSSLVGGLDSSILIDPRRLHITLGVMALDDSVDMPTEAPKRSAPTLIERPPNSASTIIPLTENLPPASTISSEVAPITLSTSQFV